MLNKKRELLSYFLILAGSILYSAATVLFIFPNSLLLGGTSGISVMLDKFFPSLSSGNILVIINILLLVLAFVFLGKNIAIKVLVGSILTTLFIGFFEPLFSVDSPIISNNFLSATIGSSLIAISSGIIFYVDSSSGGTDIVALIIKKYSHLDIGKALLVTDILIVIVGGIISETNIFLSSLLGLFIKTLGIDLVIHFINTSKKKKNDSI